MDISISSIKIHEMIFPNKCVDFGSEKETYLLIQPFENLIIRSDNEDINLKKNELFIGQKFSILNSNHEMVSYRGLLLKGKLYLNGTILKEQEFLTLLNDFFNHLHHFQKKSCLIERKILGLANNLKKLNNDEKKSIKIDLKLIKINRYIRNNFDQPISLQILADLINCNPTYLCNTYSKVFKISPIKYLQNIRMNNAKSYLEESSLAIKDIAHKVGYISGSQFSDLFFKYYKITPTQYRYNFCSLNNI